MNRLQRFFLLFIVLAAPLPAAAQAPPVKGVVWEVPQDEAEALRTLVEMHQAGVQAVRTGLVRSESLLALADTLGLQIYQDLPVARLGATALRDTLAAARALLDEALDRARGHPSARAFGLARSVETSDSAACAYVDSLARHVRARGPAGARVYYQTAFVERDACAGAVDLVLLDARDDPEPGALLRRWQAVQDVPAGIGALGTWVRLDAPRGLGVPYSEEAQARFLEDVLSALLGGDAEEAPPVVFVHRWKDVRTDVPSPARALDMPYRSTYGLYRLDGTPRPARDVVEGFYTGRQTVFAFPVGERTRPPLPWLVLLGWGIFAMLGVFYALSPRFRHMLPRYFVSHNFYQQAVREGRDVLFGASTVLLTAESLGAGMVASITLELLRAEKAFVFLFGRLPEGVQTLLLTLMEQPWLLVLLLACVYASSIVLWTSLLAVVSRRRYALVPGQTLMLTVWPRWPLLAVTAAAMVVPTLPPAWRTAAAGVVVGSWVLVSFGALIRTLYDYTSITRVPVYLSLVLTLFSPLMLVGLAVLLLALQVREALPFLWHLAVRG